MNPTGAFELGGPHADCGLTGRKIIVDTYGGMARHGGGAFSGKDPTKVDRSAAYAVRHAAKNIVAAGIAERCEVQVAYAIGVAHPVSVMVETFGTSEIDPAKLPDLVQQVFDLRPAAIIERLNLRRPIFRQDVGVRPLRPARAHVHLGGHRPRRRAARPRPKRSPDHFRNREPGRLGSAGCSPTSPRLTRAFDYLGAARAGATPSRVGTIVRVPLHGRRVRGWVLADDVESEVAAAQLRPVQHGGVGGPAARRGRAARVGGLALGGTGGHVPAGRVAPVDRAAGRRAGGRHRAVPGGGASRRVRRGRCRRRLGCSRYGSSPGRRATIGVRLVRAFLAAGRLDARPRPRAGAGRWSGRGDRARRAVRSLHAPRRSRRP